MSVDAFFGLRATDDFTVTGQRPESWREMILYLYPNGDAPLTALMSKMSNESVDDPHFHWYTKSLPSQSAAVTNVYTNSTLVTAYVSGGVASDILYVKMTAANIVQFRVGHQVLLRDQSDLTVDVTAKVTAKTVNGASSYLTVYLLEADDNSTLGDLSDCDYVLIIGNSNAEGAQIPDAISYDPTEHENYTQIFRTPLEITRTARKTKLRTGDAYKEAKREALELHSIEMEKALLWGVLANITGANGKPERFTNGLIPNIRANSGNVSSYKYDEDFDNTTWLLGGENWLDKWLEVIFRHGSDTRLGFVGSGALLAINKLIKANGNFEFTEKTYSYGIRAFEWVTPFGTLLMKRHPLFSYETSNRNNLVIFDPSDLKSRYIDDTGFYADGEKQNTGHGRYDGTKEEYLTEIGMEHHFPIKCGFLYDIGEDNPA
ncbi:DUF5309 family protein [Candidatus Pacearchaeota archaeon]|nr:DUF5309 family protein [Candidatus Pacearchaeota archaeon]